MVRTWGLHVVVCAVLGSAACTFAWGEYDPRDGEPNEGSSTNSSSTSSSSTSSSSGGGDATTSTTSAGGNGTGGNTSDGGGGAGGEATGGGGAGGAPTSFMDTFDRASGSALGNGWIEKTPDAFGLFDDHVIRTDPGSGYRDNLVYRPQSEAQLDIEVRMEFQFVSASIQNPGIFARADYDTIADPNTFIGYEAYVSDANTVRLGQGTGTADSTVLKSIDLTTPLVDGELYRLRMRVRDTVEVDVDVWVEHWVNAGSWTSLGATRFHDDTAARIDTPGAVGFNGSTGTEYFLDNFEYFVP